MKDIICAIIFALFLQVIGTATVYVITNNIELSLIVAFIMLGIVGIIAFILTYIWS